jgi:hypothetical protein
MKLMPVPTEKFPRADQPVVERSSDGNHIVNVPQTATYSAPDCAKPTIARRRDLWQALLPATGPGLFL